VNVAVNGTVVPAPAIAVTGSLSSFSQTVGAPSTVKTYTVAGANLTGNIVITAPAKYELSTDGTTWSTNPVTLTQTNGTIATTTISVRLNATAAGTYSGNITHVSAGATTINLAVSGTTVLPPSLTVTQSLIQFLQLMGSPSRSQTYTLAGANLTGSVTITPPVRYELSLNGSVWQTTALALAPTNGTLPSTTVYVRLNGSITGAHNGDLVHATNGVAPIAVPVHGWITITERYGVYPIPAYSTVYIVHPQPTVKTEITIYAVSGQKIKVVDAQPNTLETPIDISGMRQGLYMVEVNSGYEKTVLRFIKE
jgi:hypothetical protein